MSSSFFHRPLRVKPSQTSTVVDAATAPDASIPHIDTSHLTSQDPDVSAFYAQLNHYERIAHTIAIDKLGTSYDVTRTHSFLKWKKQSS